MCILIVKPAKKLVPSRDILQECFSSNRDGAGIAYNKDGKIVIKKGFMTFEDFYKEAEKIPTESTALLHCRIGTSGGNVPALTHPYPLTNDIKALKKTSQVLSANDGEKCYAVGHNGIFRGLKESGEVNDTCMFIANILTPLKEACGDILSNDLDAVVERLVDTSKIAILDNYGNVKRYGSGWIEDDGIYYSNSTYKKVVYKYNTTTYKQTWYGRNSFLEYVNEEYGSWTKYQQWNTLSKDEQWKVLYKTYPEEKSYIDTFKNSKYTQFSPTTVRGYISENKYYGGNYKCGGYYEYGNYNSLYDYYDDLY